MFTMKEMTEITGLSARTLRYYDTLGLLTPASVTGAGYRLYGEKELERLQSILFYRELEFPLKTIREILDSPSFDIGKALAQQTELLEARRDRLERIIAHARQLQRNGEKLMDFTAFDEKSAQYAEQAKQQWGGTDAYREFEKKSAGRGKETEQALGRGLMEIFARFGAIKNEAPDGENARRLVKELQTYITDNYYTCTEQILSCLGQMYAAGGEMTDNIDSAGGKGTAVFAAEAIRLYTGG